MMQNLPHFEKFMFVWRRVFVSPKTWRKTQGQWRRTGTHKLFMKGNNGEYILFWRPFESFPSEMSERKPFESCGSEHVLSYSTRRVVSKCLNKFQARCLLFLVKAWKHENLPRKWFPEFVAYGRKIRMFLDAGKVVSFSSDNGQEAVVCETLSDKSRKDRITSLKIYP